MMSSSDVVFDGNDLKNNEGNKKQVILTYSIGNRVPMQRDKSENELNVTILEKMHLLAEEQLKNSEIETALETYQECLDQYFETNGKDPKNPKFSKYFKEALKKLNDQALKLLKGEKIHQAKVILEKCEEFTNGQNYGMFPVSRNVTFNHLACVYRRLGMLDVAMGYLNTALDFVSANERMETAGITQINICAILSQLNNHVKALEHAKKAVYECSLGVINMPEEKIKSSSDYSKKVTMLAIAYHNLAIEEEHCGNISDAIDAYYKAYEILERTNGSEDLLAKKFRASYLEAKDKYPDRVSFRKNSSLQFKNPIIPSLKGARSQYSQARSVGLLKKYNSTVSSSKAQEKRIPSSDSRVYFADNRIVFANRQQQQLPVHFTQSQKIAVPKENFQQQQEPSPKYISQRQTNEPRPSSQQGKRPQTANSKARYHIDSEYAQEVTENIISKKESFENLRHKKSASNDYNVRDFDREIQEIEDLLAFETERKEIDREIKKNRVNFLRNLQNFSNVPMYDTAANPLASSLPNKEQDTKLINKSPEKQAQPSKKEEAFPTKAPKTKDQLPSKALIPAERRAHGAAIRIQKYIKGTLTRIKYKRNLKEQRYWLLFKAIAKLGLDPEDPYDMHNYQVLIWYDLLQESVIYQIKRIFNKKQFYTAKVKHLLSADYSETEFLQEIRNRAIAMLRLTYLEDDLLKFKPANESVLTSSELTTTKKKQQNEPVDNSKNLKGNQSHNEDLNSQEHDLVDNRLSDRMIRRIQALIRGRLSRATFMFLGQGMYRVRDSISFRYQGHNINIRILQKYPPHSKNISSNPTKFLIYANDWSDCIEFDHSVVPAAHFKGKEIKVEFLMDSLEINLIAHQIKYRPGGNSMPLSHRNSEDEPNAQNQPAVGEEKKRQDSEENTLGLDERTIRLILKVQKIMRGHLWRKKYNFFDMKYYRVVFSKSFMHEKHVINIRIMESIYKENAPPNPEIIITAQDLTDKVRFGTVTFNKAVFGGAVPSSLSIQDVLQHIEFNVKTHIMKYKIVHEPKAKEEEKKKDNEQEKNGPQEKVKSPKAQTPTHNEANDLALDKQSAELAPQVLKEQKEREDEAARRIQRLFKNCCKNLLFLTKVPLDFPNGKEFEASVYFNVGKQEVWLDLRSTHSEWQTIKLTVEELGLKRFNKIEFLEDIDFYILSHLFLRNNALVFERGNTYTVSISKHEDPDSISTKIDQLHFKPVADYVPEKIDTNFDYEKEFIDELAGKVLHEYVVGARYKYKQSEGDTIAESTHDKHEEKDPPEIEQWKATVQKSIAKKGGLKELEAIKESATELEATNMMSATNKDINNKIAQSNPNEWSHQVENDSQNNQKQNEVEENQSLQKDRDNKHIDDQGKIEEQKEASKSEEHPVNAKQPDNQTTEIHHDSSKPEETKASEQIPIESGKENNGPALNEEAKRNEKLGENNVENVIRSKEEPSQEGDQEPKTEIKASEEVEKHHEEKKTENEQSKEGTNETAQTEKSNDQPKKKKPKKSLKNEVSDTNSQNESETQSIVVKKKKKTKKKTAGEQGEEQKKTENDQTDTANPKKPKKSKVIKKEELVDIHYGEPNSYEAKSNELSDSKKKGDSKKNKKKKNKAKVSDKLTDEESKGNQLLAPKTNDQVLKDIPTETHENVQSKQIQDAISKDSDKDHQVIANGN